MKAGQKLLMAVSGGVDSICMAKVLHEYRRSIDPALIIEAVYVQIDQAALSEKDKKVVADYLKTLTVPRFWSQFG